MVRKRPGKQGKSTTFANSPIEAESAAGRFTSINESFLCEHCGRDIPPLRTGCRNHCPFCLVSKHVDVMPGDRMNACGGLMDPVGYELEGRKGVIIRFKCRRCGGTGRNKAALDDPGCPDDYDVILRLTPDPGRL